jgi:hypothetical protein
VNIKEFCDRFPDHAEEVEERAAIMEIDGNVSRFMAEKFAVLRVRKKHGLFTQGELTELFNVTVDGKPYKSGDAPGWEGHPDRP